MVTKPKKSHSGRNSTADVLRPGTTLLRGQYSIVGFLSAGGFGITYLAKDSLDRTVVIKECFPSSMCFRELNTVQVRSRSHEEDFASVVRSFGVEARRLAKLDHPHIVGVHQVFEDNDTAYMALDLIEGDDLLERLRDTANPPTPDWVKATLLKLLDAIDYIHSNDILHRDIAPDNILIDDAGEPILIDFGAAREEAIRTTRMLSAVHTVKDGYSPYEFYVIGSPQGPSSDLYALAATFYHVITGAAPPDSQSRVAAVAEGRSDPYVPLSSHESPYDRFFIGAINKALEIFPRDRLQSAKAWVEQINEEKRRAAALDRARQDREVEDSIFRLVAETNEAVRADIDRENLRTSASKPARVPVKKAPRPRAVAPIAPMPQPQPQPRSAPPAAAPPKAGGGIAFGLPITAALWRFALRRLSFSTRSRT